MSGRKTKFTYLDYVDMTEKLPVFYDIESLNTYCELCLSDGTKYVQYTNLMNLFDLINSNDEALLINHDGKMARFLFIKNYLDGRLMQGLKRELAVRYVFNNTETRYHDIIRREILDSIEPDSLGKKEIEFINGMIFAQLNTSFMHKYRIGLQKIIEDIETNIIYKKTEQLVPFFQTLLSDLMKAERRSKQENRFNLSDPALWDAVLQDSIDKLLSTDQFLVTGIHMLNALLNGGFENGRVYNFIGATGGFKSGLLLNIMKWFKMYNKQPVKNKKRRTILFISQENNIHETIQRIFNIFASVDHIKNYTVSEIKEMLKQGGFSICSDEEDIDIEFRYYGNEDLSVPDIKGIVQELENDGKEVIAIIQDYVERLRPPHRNVDRRVQLFDITNQLHDLAVELHIPIVTASQLNRTAIAMIEEATSGGKSDIGKNLGQSHVSESFGMLKNIDVNIIMIVEYNAKERKYYLTFKKVKLRGADNGKVDFMAHPFEGFDSKIMLKDDIESAVSLSKLTLSDAIPQEQQEKILTKKNKSIKERKLITDGEDELVIQFKEAIIPEDTFDSIMEAIDRKSNDIMAPLVTMIEPGLIELHRISRN